MDPYLCLIELLEFFMSEKKNEKKKTFTTQRMCFERNVDFMSQSLISATETVFSFPQ